MDTTPRPKKSRSRTFKSPQGSDLKSKLVDECRSLVRNNRQEMLQTLRRRHSGDADDEIDSSSVSMLFDDIIQNVTSQKRNLYTRTRSLPHGGANLPPRPTTPLLSLPSDPDPFSELDADDYDDLVQAMIEELERGHADVDTSIIEEDGYDQGPDPDMCVSDDEVDPQADMQMLPDAQSLAHTFITFLQRRLRAVSAFSPTQSSPSHMPTPQIVQGVSVGDTVAVQGSAGCAMVTVVPAAGDVLANNTHIHAPTHTFTHTIPYPSPTSSVTSTSSTTSSTVSSTSGTSALAVSSFALRSVCACVASWPQEWAAQALSDPAALRTPPTLPCPHCSGVLVPVLVTTTLNTLSLDATSHAQSPSTDMHLPQLPIDRTSPSAVPPTTHNTTPSAAMGAPATLRGVESVALSTGAGSYVVQVWACVCVCGVVVPAPISIHADNALPISTSSASSSSSSSFSSYSWSTSSSLHSPLRTCAAAVEAVRTAMCHVFDTHARLSSQVPTYSSTRSFTHTGTSTGGRTGAIAVSNMGCGTANTVVTPCAAAPTFALVPVEEAISTWMRHTAQNTQTSQHTQMGQQNQQTHMSPNTNISQRSLQSQLFPSSTPSLAALLPAPIACTCSEAHSLAALLMSVLLGVPTPHAPPCAHTALPMRLSPVPYPSPQMHTYPHTPAHTQGQAQVSVGHLSSPLASYTPIHATSSSTLMRYVLLAPATRLVLLRPPTHPAIPQVFTHCATHSEVASRAPYPFVPQASTSAFPSSESPLQLLMASPAGAEARVLVARCSCGLECLPGT